MSGSVSVEEVCTESKYFARVRMCGLNFLKRHSDKYMIYGDRDGNPVTVRKPENMTPEERLDAIRRLEEDYPPAGSC